jgi:glutathione peroxidase
MKLHLLALLALGACSQPPAAAPVVDVVIDHVVTDIDGRSVDLKGFRGKAMLIVNTASECGFTPQFADLEKLHRDYAQRGLVVLGFPTNDFGGQDPGTDAEIKAFAQKEFGVTFPLFSKTRAKGEKAPLWRTLTEQTPEGVRGDVKWNFTKFLVDKSGRVVGRFDSDTLPTAPEVRAAIEQQL